MALTNIFREPRREITETLVGAVVLGGLLYGDYILATALPIPDGLLSYGEIIALRMLIQPIVVVLALVGLWLALACIHAAGEGICNRLQASGIHLRPRRRP